MTDLGDEDPWLAAAATVEYRPTRPRKWACQVEACDGEPHEAEGFHWCDHPVDATDAHTKWCRHARADQRAPIAYFFVWLILAGRGWGKMLDVNTLIPTPTGWARLGDMRVGDELFDEAGNVCRILKVFDGTPDVAYRLTFSDGTTIDACADHMWVTWNAAERKALGRSPYEEHGRFPHDWPGWRLSRLLGTQVPRERVDAALQAISDGSSVRAAAREAGVDRQVISRHLREGGWAARRPVIHDNAPGPQVRTTQQIVETLTYGSRGDLNHCIPIADPLQLPHANLPVDPYILGAWLGDGTTRTGAFTCHEDDQAHLLAALTSAGYPAAANGQYIGTRGLLVDLRAAGVLNDKHVPDAYLRASIEQREAVLAGLLDTDASIDQGSGQVEFSNTNRRLIEAVIELARSLGQKPVASLVRHGKLNGVEHQPYQRVTWRPTRQCFRLPRKADHVRLNNGPQGLRNQHRMIIAAERINAEPMRCLTVTSKHSLFLAGEAMIPTHNTRTGAEWIYDRAIRQPGGRYALVARTFADGRDTMVEGEAGLLAIIPDDQLKDGSRDKAWNRSIGELFLANGSRFKIYSSERPASLRGPQHDAAWGDEAASWLDATKGDAEDTTWSNLMFGLRLGDDPRAVITTTPKPVKLLRGTKKRPSFLRDSTTITTRGKTRDNLRNVARAFADMILGRYEGTRLGRQELDAELLDDAEGALWQRPWVEDHRLQHSGDVGLITGGLRRIVIGVDPQGSKGEDTADTGIIACARGRDDRGYVLADRTVNGTPAEWGRRAIRLYHELGADRIVVERNFGGDMVRHVIATIDPQVPVSDVTASRGKAIRAEPIAAMYEQGKWSHVGPDLDELEDELCVWEPDSGQDSPNRLDALVWAATALFPPVPLRSSSQVDDQRLSGHRAR